ncbi:choice-of-anchor D domain-containing protein [Bernardetia sp.]|uniref:choice-of-anchor D domain-containing protein n=1 Tax=Bernardetia sp. TaxID=1937974 RepID=UPI0025C5F90D|nr:choice-of-anchor D domain-containing protein [Bernardetia sp.]
MRKNYSTKSLVLSLTILLLLSIVYQVKAQWQTLTTTINDVGITYDEALVIDSQNNVYFVLTEYATNLSKVMKYDGTTTTELGTGGFSGRSYYHSITVDNNDVVYVAYKDGEDPNAPVTVKKFDGTNWVLVGNAGFSPASASSPSIEIAKNGTPYVLFIDDNTQSSIVMKFNGTNWVNVGNAVNETNVGGVTSNRLKIDNNNTPYVMHNEIEFANGIVVKKFDGTNWVEVGNLGFSAITSIDVQSSSFAISPNDIPYIAFRDDTKDNKMTVKKFDGTNWVDVGNAGFSENAGYFPSLVIGQDETPYVAFEDGVTSQAQVMKFDGETWVNIGLPNFTLPMTDYISIALDQTDIPFLLYHSTYNDFATTLMSFNPSSSSKLTIEAVRENINHTTSYAFGAIAPNCSNSITQTFTIRNIGDKPLVLTNGVKITGSSDFTIQQPNNSTIQPFYTETFVVTFKPTQENTQTATISINSNDSATPSFTFTVTGNGKTGAANPISRITSNNINSFGEFGKAVAMWKNYMVVGNPDRKNATVYKHNGTSWEEEAILRGSNRITIDFGRSVDIYEDYIVVGDWRETASWMGAAYVFHKENGVWKEQARLRASDAQSEDYFGLSVAIDKEYIIVGAWGEDTAGDAAGAAYIYKREGTTWTEQTKLASNDLNGFDLFGFSVDIQNDWAIVGALRQNTNDFDEGAVYTFRRNGDTWTQNDKLQPSDISLNMNVGQDISISGDYLAITTDRDNNATGAVYIYKYNGTNWIEQSKITASNAAFRSFFGTSVDLYEDYLLVGAINENSIEVSSGAAYLYKRNGTNWSELNIIKSPFPHFSESVGTSVALSSNRLAVGAERYHVTNGLPVGAVYVANYGCFEAEKGMEIVGNNNVIANGSSSASLNTGTDFGSSNNCNPQHITKSFIIKNNGSTTLNLTGTPAISVIGSSDFTVGNISKTSIAPSESATFEIIYTPSAAGVQTATVSVKSDDIINSTYTFVIQVERKTDNSEPVIIAPATVGVNTDAGSCTASSVDLGTPNTDGNCGEVSVSNDAPSTFPIGVTTVTWTVTDDNGNTATATQEVIVVPTVELTYSANTFIESNPTSGQIGNTISISSSPCGIFEGTNGEDFVQTGKVTVTNIPDGLTASVIYQKDNELTFSLLGTASSHINTDDVDDLTVEFNNAAFLPNITTTNVTNFAINTLKVDFRNDDQDTISLDNWNIYPNPTPDGNFTVDFGISLEEDMQIIIFDAIGRAVYSQFFEKGSNAGQISLVKMAQGMYILKAKTEKETYIKQLIIN